MNAPILAVKNLSKAFGGLVAVNDVTFTIEREKITAIIGPNGAGKSTLFNLVAGVYHPSSGQIAYEGQVLNGSPAHARVSMGIARTFQSVELFGNMTVLENAMMGRHVRTTTGFIQAAVRAPQHRREEREARESALESLEFVGLADKKDWAALSLTFGQQRLLAMARALATEPNLLLLDEPAAGLNTKEKRDLARLILRIRDKGITILLVEHDMDLVMGIADSVVVLDYGEKIAEGTAAQVQQDERVIAAYLGSDEDEEESLPSSADRLLVGVRRG